MTSFIFISVFFVVVVSGHSTESPYLFSKSSFGNVYEYKKHQIVEITCYNNTFINEAFQPQEKLKLPMTLFLKDCRFPSNIPLKDVLQRLNIDVSTTKTLYIEGNIPLTAGNYTKGLNIERLDIRSNRKDFIKDAYDDFFVPLENLTELNITRIELPSIPPIKLQKVFIFNGAWIEKWNNCAHLRSLEIFDMENISEHWTLNCSKLHHISVRKVNSINLKRILYGVETSWKNLLSLSIINCKLSKIPEMLNITKKLTRLDLKANDLDDNVLSEMPLLPNLTSLDLSINKLNGSCLPYLMKKLPSLQKLVLDGNMIECHKRKTFDVLDFARLANNLESLYIRLTYFNFSCFGNTHFQNLQFISIIDMDAFEVNVIRLRDIPRTNATKLVVDLRALSNKLVFGFEEYSLLHSKNLSALWGNTSVTLDTIYGRIDCECDHYWLGRALYEYPELLKIPGLNCKSLSQTIDKSFKTQCFDAKTSSRYSLEVNDWAKGVVIDWHDSETFAWKKIKILPYFNITQGLNVSGNDITTVQEDCVPESLLTMDLRNNRLSRLNSDEAGSLFAGPQRRVWLSGNPIVCDCDNKPLLDALHKHKDKIMDFIDLKCADIGTPIYTVSPLDVCTVRYALIASGIILVLFLASLALIWRYRFELRIFLFSRGWCLYCISEEDVDSDRPYDAFLSFVHADDDYVINELLPQLEGDPDFYRICMHYRDWVVGDWIPAQIARSVSLSKRTIIVLSRNFVGSIWGNLEFRYAVAGAAREGRSRLIVLVLDDVTSGELEPEIQGYLYFNTYLHREDPWFWQKLRYAMPHRKLQREEASSPIQSENVAMGHIGRGYPQIVEPA